MPDDSQRSSRTIDPAAIAASILEAAGWARVGLTAPDEHMRRKAAEELALAIVDGLSGASDFDARQLTLFG